MATKKQTYDSLHDLLILKLSSLHYVEKELVKALPKMAKAASDPDLREAFTNHLRETEGQVTRIEEALSSLGEKTQKVPVAAIDGLIEDAQWCVDHVKTPEALDAALIAAAQSVENYEIAGYGTAQMWAEILQHTKAADLLSQTLEEEENASDTLIELADGGINERASDLEEEEAGEEKEEEAGGEVEPE